MNNMPYLATALCKPYDGVSENGLETYFNSLVVLNNNFEYICLIYQPSIRILIGGALAQFIREYYIARPYPGNLIRFDHLAEIADGDMNPERWIVFTDAFDVVWQKELPDFSQFDQDTVFYSSEGELWKDSSFFNGMMNTNELTDMSKLGEFDIACAGGFAMTVRNFRSFVNYTETRRPYYNRVITLSDQPMFNEWLWLYGGDRVKPVNHESLFGTLHNNFNIGNIVKKEDNKFYNRKDELFTMVHGNGNTKEILYGPSSTKNDNEGSSEHL